MVQKSFTWLTLLKGVVLIIQSECHDLTFETKKNKKMCILKTILLQSLKLM